MAVHDRGILQRLRQRLGCRLGTDVGRAQRGHRLVADHRNLAAEQREQVAGMVGVRGQQAVLGDPTVEHRGHGPMGEVVLARRVAEPRTHRRQLSESGKPVTVDRAVWAHDRGGRELVEDEHDDRTADLRDGHVPDVVAPASGDQLRRRADEQEHGDERDVGDGEVGQQQTPGVRSHRQHHGGRAAGQRHDDDQHDRIDPDRAEQGEDEGSAEHSDDDAVDDGSGAPVDQRGNGDRGNADQRRDQGDDQGEPDDLARAVVAGDEELRVATEQIEERLGDGQAAQAENDE